MATASADDSAAANYAAQAGVATALTIALQRLWDQTIDLTRLSETIPVFKRGATALVAQYSSAARSMALAHYADMRRHAGVAMGYRPPLTPLPPTEQINAVVDWATRALWSPTGGQLPPADVVSTARGNTQSGLAKAVLDIGRDQVINATENDRTAIAWAREAKPDACWFCAMLATRGAVYTSAEAAGLAKPKKGQTPTGLDRLGKEFVNRYHDHCRCQVVPVFVKYEPTAQAREWTALWNKTMRPNGPGGPREITGMDAMQAAWKAALAASRAK